MIEIFDIFLKNLFMKIILVFLALLLNNFAFSQNSVSLYQNIIDFGAKNDGLSDASSDIQKAVDYCEKNSIKTLLIPDGKYLLKNSVIFRKGGVQIVGTGALLREESWVGNIDKMFADNKPFVGCTFIVEKNVAGFVYDKTVGDPVRISNVQFLAKEDRTVGNTTAISFRSEFAGPTWPFIIEKCHFRGFNYAIKFESDNQYNVAFLQMSQNAFSQNDECVYFSDIPERKIQNVGMRNLSWGFDFLNNQCHDNSRVIRGSFAKDQVNIKNNNMEGNIAYADGRKPKFIVDIEISNATVNFEGNHFESVISDCVYISSAFMKKDGSFFPYSGSTTASDKNKVFIKGNNFDGVNEGKFKALTLKGLHVYNYDQYVMYIDECDIRQNSANALNLFLSDNAKTKGSAIKTPFGKYENASRVLQNYSQIKQMTEGGRAVEKIVSPNCNIDFIRVSKKDGAIFGNGSQTMQVATSDKYIGASYLVNNPVSSGFLGVSVVFYVSYSLNGKTINETKYASGNYGAELGFTTITGIIPNDLPKIAKNISVWSGLSTSVLGDTDIFIGNKFTLFTYSGDNPYFIPVFKI